MAKLTISDIARMANVSTATVSFVLNGRPGICDETRSRVQAIIDETGYKPNVHTRRLTLRKSMTVHVVMRQYQYTLFNFFSLEVLMGIFRESRRLGYNIIFTSVDFTASDARSNFDYVVDTVRTGDADGVIFIQAADPAVLTTLQNEHFPFLCVDSHVKKDGSIPLLEMDYYDASYRATQYLIDNGYVDCVIQLPDNLFFGTTIATNILILRRGKQDSTTLFIDASKECVKVTNSNKLTQDNIEHIVQLFTERKEVPHVAHLAAYEEIVEQDYNLSVSTYVEAEDTREKVDIVKLNAEIEEIVAREDVLRSEIRKIIAEIEG